MQIYRFALLSEPRPRALHRAKYFLELQVLVCDPGSAPSPPNWSLPDSAQTFGACLPLPPQRALRL